MYKQGIISCYKLRYDDQYCLSSLISFVRTWVSVNGESMSQTPQIESNRALHDNNKVWPPINRKPCAVYSQIA